jgi:hypothetical protein
MSEAEQSGSYASASSVRGEAICDKIIEAFKEAANAIVPPEAATKHFRESRVQFWLGIREMVDGRIARLSRDKAKGTRVVVE